MSFAHQFALRHAPAAYLARQVHGNDVLEVTGAESRGETRTREADALVTYTPGVIVGVYTSDCVPILIEDAEGGGCAAVHAGWRGLASGVVQAALSMMRGSPEGVCAALGPSIGPCCFEVGPEVAQLFAPFVHERSPRAHVDLRAAVTAALRDAGISRIDASRADCTSCSPTGYPSYRRDGPGGPGMTHVISYTLDEGTTERA